jgi:hypothetical protein
MQAEKEKVEGEEKAQGEGSSEEISTQPEQTNNDTVMLEMVRALSEKVDKLLYEMKIEERKLNMSRRVFYNRLKVLDLIEDENN